MVYSAGISSPNDDSLDLTYADQDIPQNETVDSINELIELLESVNANITIESDAPVRSANSSFNAGFSVNNSNPTSTQNILYAYANPNSDSDNSTIDRGYGYTDVSFDSRVNSYSLRYLIENLRDSEATSSDSNVSLLLNTYAQAYSPIRGNNNLGKAEISPGNVTIDNYEFKVNVTENFIEEANQFIYDSSDASSQIASQFTGFTSDISGNEIISLQEYYDNNSREFDYNKLNRDINLKATFEGNLLESNYDSLLDSGSYLSLQSTDSNGDAAYINFESRDNDRNLNGVYNRLDRRDGSVEYDETLNVTTFELGLNHNSALKLFDTPDNVISFSGNHGGAWVQKLDSYGNGNLDASQINLNFGDFEDIPTSEFLASQYSFSATSPNFNNTIDFRDHTNGGALNLLDADFVSGNIASYRTSLDYKLYDQNNTEIGNFYYSIGEGGYDEMMMEEGGYEGEYEDFSGWSYSVDNWGENISAELNTVRISNNQGNIYFMIDENSENPTSNGEKYGDFENASGFLSSYIPEWEQISSLELTEYGGLDITHLEQDYYLEGQHDGDAVLCLEYELSEIDASSFYEGMPFKSDALEQLAVLGDSVDWNKKFVLDITAESYLTDYNIESTDITIDFDPNLFGTISQEHVMIGGALPVGNAVEIDNDNGTIRIAAASLSDLNTTTQNTGFGISGTTPLVSIALDFDEYQVQNLDKNPDGSLTISPLAFDISANQQETILSRSFTEIDTGLTNREIVTLDDLGGGIDVYGTDVTLYEAKINLEEQGDGLVLGTQRVIGADKSFTNLVRANDTLTTSAEWLNVGNIEANNLTYTSLYNDNAELVNASFSQTSVGSGSFENGSFVEDARESTRLTADIKIADNAGQVLDLADGIISVEATGSEIFTNGFFGQGSSNLITYQGDLNYDGRVSMKDLAYLNAGAARQDLVNGTDENGNSIEVASETSYARDVDADFNGKIDLADLSVLDQDWGRSLHTSDQGFTGSDDVSWNELDNQGQTSWDNDSFKDQNSIEADTSYEGSLESPSANGVIGADGNENANDGDLGGNSVFQDPLAV